MTRMTFLIGVAALFGVLETARTKTVTDAYPGQLLREEILATSGLGRRLVVTFAGVREGLVCLQVAGEEAKEVRYRGIHQKILVRRDPDNPEDPGVREVAFGETVSGEVQSRVEIVALGPVGGLRFAFLGGEVRSDLNGLVCDVEQRILSAFDDLGRSTLEVVLQHPEHGAGTLEVTREMLRKALGVRFSFTATSHVRQLAARAEWDRTSYRPGQVATLTVVAANTGKEGDVHLVRGGRSLSRWPWLDGAMFYFGTVAPGRTVQFARRFVVPADVAPGTYFLRVGFNDYSGAKPQLQACLRVREADVR